MRTLYVRNVPDEVVERLEEVAAREGLSVNAVVVKELEGLARRTRNAAIFDALPSTHLTTTEILAAIDDGRRER
jgi:plasmid stability protein